MYDNIGQSICENMIIHVKMKTEQGDLVYKVK